MRARTRQTRQTLSEMSESSALSTALLRADTSCGVQNTRETDAQHARCSSTTNRMRCRLAKKRGPECSRISGPGWPVGGLSASARTVCDSTTVRFAPFRPPSSLVASSMGVPGGARYDGCYPFSGHSERPTMSPSSGCAVGLIQRKGAAQQHPAPATATSVLAAIHRSCAQY